MKAMFDRHAAVHAIVMVSAAVLAILAPHNLQAAGESTSPDAAPGAGQGYPIYQEIAFSFDSNCNVLPVDRTLEVYVEDPGQERYLMFVMTDPWPEDCGVLWLCFDPCGVGPGPFPSSPIYWDRFDECDDFIHAVCVNITGIEIGRYPFTISRIDPLTGVPEGQCSRGEVAVR